MRGEGSGEEEGEGEIEEEGREKERERKMDEVLGKSRTEKLGSEEENGM